MSPGTAPSTARPASSSSRPRTGAPSWPSSGRRSGRTDWTTWVPGSSWCVPSGELGPAETRGEVVVHQPRRLEVGVADDRADEPEAASPEVLAETPGDVGLGRDLGGVR